jgi:hypothetical protein
VPDFSHGFANRHGAMVGRSAITRIMTGGNPTLYGRHINQWSNEMTNSVNIEKTAWEKIIVASAASKHPIDDDTLRDLAAQRGDNPDAVVEQHREFREMFEKKAEDNSGPMPFIL